MTLQRPVVSCSTSSPELVLPGCVPLFLLHRSGPTHAQLKVNGEQRSLDAGLTHLNQVIEALGHHPKLVVVEFNGLILTPDRWAEQAVKDGDSLEIVTIVGGGS